MKRRNHFTALTLLLIFCTVLPACQKCETCSYTYQDMYGNNTTYTYPETCGEKFKRQAQEESCQAMASMSGSTCVCTKK